MKVLIFLLLLVQSIAVFSKELIVGVITSAPPFSDMSHTSTGAYFFGFSIDIMDDICRRLQIKCTFSQVNLDTQFAALEKGTVDVVLLAYPYDLSEHSQFAISLPYLVSNIQFIANQTSSLKKGDPIKNLKIGVVKTTFYTLLNQSVYGKDNKIIPFLGVDSLISALVGHQVDAILLNSAIAFNYINNNTYNIKPISSEIAMGGGYGIIALPVNGALIKQMNQAILRMQSDGSYLAIYNKYYTQSTDPH
jgi:ABC-type amino acid transport substrate-binding protein